MALIEARCLCQAEGCECPTKSDQWVDAISNYCRDCESKHADGLGQRWGPKGRRA